jgi:phosphate transport system permease protein
MTLPTVIITTRASLKAVPPSIRQAALGLGASRVQTVFHHVLPLALPGIMTGAIIGVAHALGETAPLLLIGMSAFVASVPALHLINQQLYLYKFIYGKVMSCVTSSKDVQLLRLLSTCIDDWFKQFAIWLRKKFEVRW